MSWPSKRRNTRSACLAARSAKTPPIDHRPLGVDLMPLRMPRAMIGRSSAKPGSCASTSVNRTRSRGFDGMVLLADI
ncbi:Uncharacterised protein [Mycobacteroides abscessus subsp. abscessus]|nr:Uncharacterised protein [Mycobacteroides abscessus subsp. abscessus]